MKIMTMAIEILIRFSSRLDFIEFLTRAAAPSRVFEDAVKKHGSASTLACGRQAAPPTWVQWKKIQSL